MGKVVAGLKKKKGLKNNKGRMCSCTVLTLFYASQIKSKKLRSALKYCFSCPLPLLLCCVMHSVLQKKLVR